MMANELVITGSQSFIPVQVAAAGKEAAKRFIEFFTANIRNPNTRAAYARSVAGFFRWCDGIGLHRLDAVESVHVAGYVRGARQDAGCPKRQAASCGGTDALRLAGGLERRPPGLSDEEAG